MAAIPAVTFMHIVPVIHDHEWPLEPDENGSTECLAKCGHYMEDHEALWGGERSKASAVDVLREVFEAMERGDDICRVEQFVHEYLSEIGAL